MILPKFEKLNEINFINYQFSNKWFQNCGSLRPVDINRITQIQGNMVIFGTPRGRSQMSSKF